MTTNERTDALPEFAARYYAVHFAIQRLGDKSPAHLDKDLATLQAKIESFGGKVTEGKDVFGEIGPVVLNKAGENFNYDTGRGMGEKLVSDILEALARKS